MAVQMTSNPSQKKGRALTPLRFLDVQNRLMSWLFAAESVLLGTRDGVQDKICL